MLDKMQERGEFSFLHVRCAMDSQPRQPFSRTSSRAESTSSAGGSNVGMSMLKSPNPATPAPSASTVVPTPPSPATSQRDQQVEKLLKEVKHLKQKVDVLDKENTALKKSIYDLSARYAASISQGGLQYRPGPFVIENDSIDGTKGVIGSKAQQVISMAVQEAGGAVDSYHSGTYPRIMLTRGWSALIEHKATDVMESPLRCATNSR